METLKEITLKLPWLKNLPGDWEIERGKRLFKKVQRSFDDKSETVTAFRDGQVTLRKNRRLEGFTESIKEFGYQGVNKGDLVIHSMDGFAGAIGVSDSDGKCSPVYNVCLPIANANQYFYSFLLRYLAHQKYIMSLAKGIRERSTDFRFEDFGNLILPVPPRKQQDAIVNFLDKKIADIDKYISAKQKLISLLNEQIFGIVLRGFNSKKLGWSLNWLNDIPESWIKQKAKWIFNEIKVYNKPEEQLLAVTQDRGVLPKDLCESNFVSPSGSLAGLKLVEENDFVISLRSFQGGLEFSKYRGIVSPAYNVIRLNSNYNSSSLIKYYQYLFKTKRFIQLLNTIISGIRDGKNINFSDFGNLILPVPTSEDLVKMMKYFSQFELLKEKFDKEKILLKELGSSLIAESVTGKLKLTANIYEIRKPKNPYFARTVLAAEIINELYKETTFGRVKLVKLLFLSERLAKLKLETNYHRQAAGPYDNRAIRSIEKQLKEHQWFETIKRDKGKGYKPLDKINEYHSWFDKYYHNKKHIIHSVINTFRTAKTIQCEIIATLYSAWEDLLKNTSIVTDDEIVNEVLTNWHESKQRIPKVRWFKALNWMREKQIIPINTLPKG